MGQKTERLFEEGRAYLAEEDYESALRVFNEVLNREPTHQKAMRNKAMLKMMGDDEQEAEDFLRFAAQQLPEDAEIQQMLGTFYLNTERPAKAFAPLEKAVSLDTQNALAYYQLGMLYARHRSEHKTAIEYFSKALKADEGFGEAYFSRGCSHMILENMQQAEKDLNRARERGHKEAGRLLSEYF